MLVIWRDVLARATRFRSAFVDCTEELRIAVTDKLERVNLREESVLQGQQRRQPTVNLLFARSHASPSLPFPARASWVRIRTGMNEAIMADGEQESKVQGWDSPQWQLRFVLTTSSSLLSDAPYTRTIIDMSRILRTGAL